MHGWMDVDGRKRMDEQLDGLIGSNNRQKDAAENNGKLY